LYRLQFRILSLTGLVTSIGPLQSTSYSLVQLFLDGLWLVAIAMSIFFAGLFLFTLLSDKLLDRLFSIGVPSEREPQKRRRKLLPRSLSLPVVLPRKNV
ncbi:hypothetical protein, partial [Chromatocurvus halotolerans]